MCACTCPCWNGVARPIGLRVSSNINCNSASGPARRPAECSLTALLKIDEVCSRKSLIARILDVDELGMQAVYLLSDKTIVPVEKSAYVSATRRCPRLLCLMRCTPAF